MDTNGFGFGIPRSGANPFRTQSFTAGSPHTNRKMHQKQDPPIEYDLYVGLEEILKGSIKKMKITKKVLTPDGKGYKKEDKVLSINVRPGWKAGTKITFQREGDQNANSIPADIVFVIKDKPHPQFKREGADVKYTARITLREVSAKKTLTFTKK
jgi:molecular chaperone, putative